MNTVPHDCVAALLVRDGRVLLGRRANDREWLPGAWALPGGHVQDGESAEAALARELAEETGIAPEHATSVAVLEGGGVHAWRLQVFLVDDWRGELANRQSREHAELRWCGLAEAQRLLGSAHPGFADLLRRVLPELPEH